MTTIDFNRQADPRRIGEKLKLARTRAGYTQADAAGKIGVARTTLVAVEKGDREATADEIVGLAELYQVGLNDLVDVNRVELELQPQFRAVVKNDTMGALDAGEVLERYASLYLSLEQVLGINGAIIDSPVYRWDVPGRTPEQAGEEIAEEERRRFGLGSSPVGGLRELLEKEAGLRIFCFPMDGRISGLFAYNDSVGGCIGINSRHPPERGTWSLAHEFGHYVSSRFDPDLHLLAGAWGKSRNERFADSFAAHFLMPRLSVNRRFTEIAGRQDADFSVADLFDMAHDFRVSVAAMCLRLEELKRVPRGTWSKLKSRGLKVETARSNLGLSRGDPPEPRFPYRYRVLARMAFERGLISEGQLSKYLDTDRLSAREELDRLTESSDGDGTADWDLGESLLQSVN